MELNETFFPEGLIYTKIGRIKMTVPVSGHLKE
jgi:hypothetical protein